MHTIEGASKAPCIPVKVNGEVEVNAIIDTGSDATLISNSLYDRLSSKPEVKGRTEFKTAGGSSTCMITEKLNDVIIQVGKYDYEHSIFKGDLASDTNVILGMDFLSKIGAIINFSTNTLDFMEECIPFCRSAVASLVEGQVDPVVRKVTKTHDSS